MASADRPVNIGVSLTPRVTNASRSFSPIQPDPARTLAFDSIDTRGTSTDAGLARVASADAQIATQQKAVADAVVTAPVTGTVTERLVEAGEIIQPRAPILIVTNLDQVWANVYVDEPVVPRLKVGQAATLFTDAGGPGIQGVISYVSPSAEFTPRNVQTAEDRSKLVYRVKVTVDNKEGVLKSGMPVEAEIPVTP